ncbi:MAG: tetratricopeptide repeat-containing sulfotransferase family protein [Alphaproteobacteria bacterium]
MRTQKGANTISAAMAEIVDLIRADPAAAEQRAIQLLQRAPADQALLAAIVGVRRIAGDLDGAREFLDAAALHTPDIAAVHFQHGLVLRDTGRLEEAVTALSRAVELEPSSAEARRALGDALARAGKMEEAGSAYAQQFERAVSAFRDLEEAALGPDAQLQAAEIRLREWLTAHPTDVPALQFLGNVYIRQSRFEDAEKHLARAVALAPDFATARWLLVGSLYQRQMWEQALPHVDILLKEDPENGDYLNLKAYSLLNIGEYDRAVAAYEALLEKRQSAEAWMLYGYALATVGRRDDAIAAYRKAIELKPDYGESYWSLANLKTFRFGPDDVAAMRTALARPDLNARSRAQMQFALGKSLEDARDYAASFEAYRDGNAVWRKTITHSADGVSDFVRRTKALFTRQFFAARAGQGCAAADPIFIMGLPRSGSTLLEQILASHSMIEGTRELPALNSVAKRLVDYERVGDRRYPEAIAGLTAEQLKVAGEEFLSATRVHRKLGRPFFIDKTPSNFHHLGLLHLILPNAKIIDARRHPLGCGFAIFKQHFPYGQSFAFDLTEIGRYYRDYVEFMAHFDTVLPGRIHRVFYEDLVADAETQIRRVLDYLGLPFEESCLHFHKTDRAVLTPSAEQVRQPIYTDALEHWRNYEKWLGPLKAALGDVLDCYPGVPEFRPTAQPPETQWGISGSYRVISGVPRARLDTR